jgi:hypothetical protein
MIFRYSKSPEPIRMGGPQTRAFVRAIMERGFTPFDCTSTFADSREFGISTTRSTFVRGLTAGDGKKVELGIVIDGFSINDRFSGRSIAGGVMQVTPFDPKMAELIKNFRDRQHFGMNTPEEGLVYVAVVAPANVGDSYAAAGFHNEFARLVQAIANRRVLTLSVLREIGADELMAGIIDRDLRALPQGVDVRSIHEYG